MHRTTKTAAKITAVGTTAATALIASATVGNAAQPVCSTEPGTKIPNYLRIEIP